MKQVLETFSNKSMKFAQYVILFLALSLPAQASFVSEFVKDVNDNVGPAYYSSQERGYITFGSYSTRTKNVTVNPVSITPPSVSIGCSGIDVVTGGVSFLKKQALVDLYKQLTNPSTLTYIGVSIGMKMLSNELADTAETAMDVIQQINAMQLDGCGIADSTVMLATSKDTTEQKVNRAMDMVGKLRDNFYEAMSKINNAEDKEQHRDQKLANYSAKEFLDNGGSLLEYIYEKWTQPSSSSDSFTFPSKIDVNRVRALYGDVFYDPNAEVYRYIVPCDKTLYDLTVGFPSLSSAKGAKCETETDNNQTISQYVDEQMDAIYNALTGNGGKVDMEFIVAIQESNVLATIMSDAGAKDQAYLQSSIDHLRYAAKIEIAFRYADIYQQHLITHLEEFASDAGANGASYGTTLATKAHKVANTAHTKYNKFENEYKEVVIKSHQFIMRKQKQEQQPQRSVNPLVRIYGGGS